MAGGGGTRLWPLSRQNKPKQFCRLIGDKTMLEETFDRLKFRFDTEDIFVCLNKDLLVQAQELLPAVKRNHFFVEPERRDTAPAMGFVAAKFLSMGVFDEPIAFVPSDHFIGNNEKFLALFVKAEDLIKTTGKMVDIAVMPTFPSITLGYTHVGKLVENNAGIEVYEFLGHTEKPEFDLAKQYLQSKDYLWHASYYMWTPKKIFESFELYSPKDYESLQAIVESIKVEDQEKVKNYFSNLQKKSFDYVITEKLAPEKVLILKADFGWSDVGTFDSIYETQKSKVDENGNLIKAKFVSMDSSECFVYSSGKKMIVGVDLNDLVIVDTPESLLICPKSKSYKIKDVVQKLKEQNQNVIL